MSTLQYADAFNTPTVEALEPMDIGLDEQELKGLAHTLQVLHQYMATFNDQRAVCQAQVRQLIDECDIALDTRYPLQSFTKAPSEQNLSAVTEGVLDRIGSGFAAYSKKIWEFIKKIIAWIVSAFKRLFKREDQVIQHVNVLREVRSASTQIKTMMPRIPTEAQRKEEQAKQEARALEHLHEMVTQYEGQMTQMAMDMLTQGAFVSAVKALSFGATSVVKQIQHTLDEIQRRINTHMSGSGHSPENFRGLTDGLKAPVGVIPPVTKWLGVANSIELWDDLVRLSLINVKAISEEKPANSVIEWNIAAGVIVNAKSGLAEPMVPVSGALETYVNDMTPIVEAMLAHHVTQSMDPQFLSEAEDALHSITLDIRSMLQFMEIANLTLDCQYHLIKSVAQCAEAEFDVDCAKRVTDDAARHSVMDIRRKLSVRITEIKTGI